MSTYRFQPIVNLHTMRVIGHEVLLKLNGIIDLEKYFSEMSVEKIVDLFCEQVMFVRRGRKPHKYFINLPVASLLDYGHYSRIKAVLARAGEINLVIEIQNPDEFYLLHAEERSLFSLRVNEIRRQGVEVWVDDITPCSLAVSLQMGLRIDGVKISHSLFIGLKQRVNGLHEFVAACRKISENILAEGIETAEDMYVAIQAGCVLGQGFLWEEYCMENV